MNSPTRLPTLRCSSTRLFLWYNSHRWRILRNGDEKTGHCRDRPRRTGAQLPTHRGACAPCEGAVRSHFVIPVKGYKNEKEALKAAGFSAKLSEGDNIIVKLSELSAMPIMKSRKVPHNIGTISELTLRKFRKGISKAISRGRKGLCEDLSYLSMGWFEGDVSCYSMDEDEISGFLLFHKLPSEMLSIQLMVGLDNNYDKNLLGMVRKFIVSMEEKYPPETKIVLNRHNSASLQLAEKLLPRGFGIPVYAGNREE